MATCVPCKSNICVNPPDTEIYSLQSGIDFTSVQLSFIVSCPVGYTCTPGSFPRTITYPPGEWEIILPPGIVGGGGIIRLSGCQSDVVRVVPVGATEEEVAALVAEVFAAVAAQQAECDAISGAGSPFPPPAPTSATNDAVYFSHECEEDYCLAFVAILPAWITFDSENSKLIGIAGFFAGTTKAIANATAQAALDAYGEAALTSGDLVCVQISTASPLPNGAVGDAYSETLESDPTAVGTWTITSGSLPDGLSLNSSTGEITGTPTTEETATFTVSFVPTSV